MQKLYRSSVLIIDDEAAIRESRNLLEFEGYSVESAETGEEGLAKLPTAFDLACSILLFLTATAWRSWRTSAPRPATGVIILPRTARWTTLSGMQKGHQFIQKPGTTKTLADVRAAVAAGARRRKRTAQNALQTAHNFEHIVARARPCSGF